MVATFSAAPIAFPPVRRSQLAKLAAPTLQPGGFGGPIRGLGLRVVLAAELRWLGLTLVPGFLNDRRDLGVGEEVLKALLVPVKEHPDPVVLIGIAKDGRTFGPVLLSLLSALG